MKKIWYKPSMWVCFLIVSLLAAIGARHYFPQAIPIVHLNLTMNRSEALNAAQDLAKRLNLGPLNTQETASFNTDNLVKTFVELDAGGTNALVEMIEKKLYQPYTWRVRRFKEFEPNESVIQFTPDGTPYGFSETISETIPGSALHTKDAQAIAENYASAAPWNIHFDNYALIESSQEKRISGRIDHIFTYERPDIKIGKGFYRLRIIVTGDTVTELNHFVKVPDNFTRRYTEMRSANDTIANAAKLFIYLLYIIGGCSIGLLYLFKKRWVIWRAPLWAALIVSGLVTLQHINELPLLWMNYNTALSTTNFLLNFCLMLLFSFIYQGCLFFITFTAAESLTRKAFQNHIQFWKIWRPENTCTLALLGRTLCAYLIVPIILFYDIIFYLLTTKYLGWWVPSEALANPNILATYFPWLQSIAISLQAGFWEECLFRAIPLASAALLGERFGKKNWWIGITFILQAIIFGAAHANYPALPSYARLVEILAVSFIFGGMYLRFGLLPAIIAHFSYDVIWFSLPIFVSTAWGNQLIIVALAFIPLWIVVYSRFKAGAWSTISDKALNESWQPPLRIKQPSYQKPINEIVEIEKSTQYLLLCTGILALAAWGYTTQFINDAPPFTTQRSSIFDTAQSILEKKKIDTNAWYPLVVPMTDYQNDESSTQHRFIWQEGGAHVYHTLIGTYLTPPSWLARYVKFNGSITDRSEEHKVSLNPDGSLYRYEHIVPEEQSGKKLSELEARVLAIAKAYQAFGIQSDQLKEISAVVNKYPNRLDWKFVFSCPSEYPLQSGENRIEISIAGDQIVDTQRYIHVPEAWQRTDKNNQFIANIIRQLCILLMYLLIIFGSIFALWTLKMTIAYRMLVPAFFIFTCIYFFEYINSWPLIVSNFNTSQPFSDQLFRAFGLPAVSLITRAAMLALLFSFVSSFQNRYTITPRIIIYAISIALGVLFAGLESVAIYYAPSLKPTWAHYTPLGFILPINAGINSYIMHYITVTILLLLTTMLLNLLSAYFTHRKIATSFAILGFAFVLSGLNYADTIHLLLLYGILSGFAYLSAYVAFFRYAYDMIPIATASYVIMEILQQATFNAYPHALIISYGSMLILILIARSWHKILMK